MDAEGAASPRRVAAAAEKKVEAKLSRFWMEQKTEREGGRG